MINYKAKIILFILLASLSVSSISAQRIIVDSLDIQEPIIEKKPVRLLGVKYGYAFTGVQITPDYKAKGAHAPLNISVLYTYYHPLWGFMDIFGIQTGLKYGTQGFTTHEDYTHLNLDQTISTLEIPLLSAFKFDLGDHFRILLSLGPYAGYRFNTSREGGFDCFDKRFDYGLLGGAGIAIRLNRFELHLEGYYQYSFSFLYHPEKLSSTGWLYSYPYQMGITLGIHISL